MAIPIPDPRDGLTPQGRLILTHLHTHLAKSTRPYVKTVQLLRLANADDPLASLPELYEVLLRMVRDWSCRYPLIENQGTIGSIDGDPPAPMRFNEMGMTPYGEAMFPDHGQGSPMAGTFPQILCNGALAHSGKVVLNLEGRPSLQRMAGMSRRTMFPWRIGRAESCSPSSRPIIWGKSREG